MLGWRLTFHPLYVLSNPNLLPHFKTAKNDKMAKCISSNSLVSRSSTVSLSINNIWKWLLDHYCWQLVYWLWYWDAGLKFYISDMTSMRTPLWPMAVYSSYMKCVSYHCQNICTYFKMAKRILFIQSTATRWVRWTVVWLPAMSKMNALLYSLKSKVYADF